MRVVVSSPHPGADLCWVVQEALAHEGHLLTAGELCVARAILGLSPPACELYARLTLRQGAVFRVASLRYDIDVPVAAAELVTSGLAHANVPDDLCLEAFDVPALADACRRLGLATQGTRGELETRLGGRRWRDEAVLLVSHPRLLARLERLCFGRTRLDRTSLVVERLGGLRWATYPLTGGRGLHGSRAAMALWERARAGAWADQEEAARVALDGPRTGGLDPWRYAVDAVLAAKPSSAVLGRLVAHGAAARPRWALALEAEGAVTAALEACEVGLALGTPEERVALARTGKRLARKLRASWAPVVQHAPIERVVRLQPAGRRAGRPLWRVEGRALTVEAAVLALPALRARGAVHAENELWTTLYALCLSDLYWLPVPGMLPAPRRDGPVDVGTPGFAERRRDAVRARLTAVEDLGTAVFSARWQGERLAGLSPDMVPVVASIPAGVARVVLERLLAEGWSAARGLPDLWIPPGAAVRQQDILPAVIGEAPLLVEVKGPGDAVQDSQQAWFNVFGEAGIQQELWHVDGHNIM